MYIMLFCLELVKIHLLQISIDKICVECVYHLCSERTVGSFDSIFAKYRPSYMPVGYIRYYCRVYASLETMASAEPYGGEQIVFPINGTDTGQPTANAISANFGAGNGTLVRLARYGGVSCSNSDIGQNNRVSQLQNGVTKGYVFVLTVTARHKFSSALIEKLFHGGSNTTVAKHYILWSRGVGIVN
ncbi:MAG: hypothetical protein IJA14_01875 [Alphaproteobacteria bacterium]|nr:hypothetical protein [Alphaproteobacteria bacterium]